MSAPHRPFLRRFTLALLGMLLLMAVVFAGLGWMVARDYKFPWVSNALGDEKFIRLWHWYSGFMESVMPGDRDGDLVCDGAELFEGTDPNNPMSLSEVAGPCRPDSVIHPTIIPYCGERMATRWMQGVDPRGTSTRRWPRGFHAVVSADQPILLAKDGAGAPTKGPLVVPVSESGELEFDILAERAFGAVLLDFRNPATKESFGWLRVWCLGWRTAPVPVSIDGGSPDVAFHNWVKWPDSYQDAYKMKWVAPVGWTGGYVIEAAREQGDERWQPIHWEESAQTEWSFGFQNLEDFPDYTGPLKFRVVPVSATPP